MRLSIVLSAVTAAVMFVGIHAAPTGAQEMPPTLVSVDSVRQMEFHDQVNLVGRTAALVDSRIVAEVSGRVLEVNALEGVQVQAGTPLVTIDADRLKLTLAGKESETRQARLQADLVAKQFKRAQELAAQSLISATGLDSAEAWAGITEEQYHQLQAERDKLALDVENSVIRAPYDGFTGTRLVDVGEWVNEGSPVFQMVDVSRLKVTVDLPERHFGRVAKGSKVSIMVSSDGNEPVEGTVIGVAPNASAETHTFPVIIDVPNPKGKLGGGMLVRATLGLDQKFSSLAVSKDAIVRQGTQTMVYTVTDNKAVPVPVEIASTEGGMVAVRGDGLRAGMPVVVRGNERIYPGSPVMTAEGASQASVSAGE